MISYAVRVAYCKRICDDTMEANVVILVPAKTVVDASSANVNLAET